MSNLINSSDNTINSLSPKQNSSSENISSQQKKENYLHFEFLNPIKENILTKSEFSLSNKNLINILFDNQGIEYTEGYTREKYLSFRKRSRENFRCCEVNPIEERIRTEFFKNLKNDIFYTYDKFINKLPIHITHFQVRKNFLQFRKNEIAYTTETGIQAFNLLNYLKNDLCIYPTLDSNSTEGSDVICFDICETDEQDYLICYGKSDGSIRILKIKFEELKKIRNNFSKLKYNNFLNNKGSTKSDVLCSEIISVGSRSDEILTNYVKFLVKGKYLLTTSNDCYIRIYSLEEKLVLLQSYKSNHPVNHCDFNFPIKCENDIINTNSGNNILGAIGDSNFIELFDFHNQSVISRFKAHYDYGTVIRFLPEKDYTFVTGNQDLTCKIWDLRKLKNINFNNDEIKEAQKTLCANVDSVGDIAIIDKDNFIFCENFDFFNIYNMKSDSMQTINYVGHFAGIVYQRDYDKIHIAVNERNLNGIISYAGIKNNTNSLESIEIY